METKYHENAYIKGWIKDGIIYAVFKIKEVDLEAAIACVKMRLDTSQGVSYPSFIDVRAVKSISKEARDYFASDEGSKDLVASAFLIDSVIGKFTGNFFLQINKPKIPLKLFTTESEALKWLQQFNTKEQ